MKQKPNQSTIFDWMLLVVVAAFAAKCLKLLWEVWRGWPDFISGSLESYKLGNQVVIASLYWALAAAASALIIFFRNRWHQKKESEKPNF